MKMNLITSRLMELKLKHGWISEDFAKYLDCSEEEFIAALRKVFAANIAKTYEKRLNDNNRRRNRIKKGVLDKKVVKPKVSNVTLNIHSNQETTVVKEEEGEEADMIEEKMVTVQEILTELNEKESRLRKEICNDESKRMELIADRRSLDVQLSEQKELLLKLRSQIEVAKNNVEQILNKRNEICGYIEATNLHLMEKQALLDSIQKEMVALMKVTILVYENGNIDCEGPVEYVEPDEWNEIFQEVALDDQAEDLTIKQIKQIAKVVAFVWTLQNNFEVMFENVIQQQIYERVVSKSQDGLED